MNVRSAMRLCLIVPFMLAAPVAAASPISVTDAWSRPATDTGGVFLTITNTGPADRLLSVASDVAEHVELHETVRVTPPPPADANSMVMTMRRVPAIAVAADATTVLKPGGYHVMLIALKHPLKPGDDIPLQLTFQHAGTIAVTAIVKPM